MNKKILSVLCVCALMFAITMPSQAATGYQGYAAYRDGVGEDTALGIDINWHAAIMLTADLTSSTSVSHSISGIGVKLGDEEEFMGEYNGEINSFTGYYRPQTNISSSKRDSVMLTARALASESIGYTIRGQIDYEVSDNPDKHGYVWASDISAMRCDGVVEYCYEFHNIRIYGDDTYWNISVWGSTNRSSHHNWTLINPEIQARQYMVMLP